jgi:integrase
VIPRLKEVLGLRWENIDRDAGVRFISGDNKTGKPRGIPIGATLRKLLDELPGGRFQRSGFVFVDGDGEPRTAVRDRNHVSQRTKAAAMAARLEEVSFHTLRQTAASWLAQAGHSQVKIGMLLGHATVQTTSSYMHLSPTHLRDAANGLDAALCGSLGHQQDTEPSTSGAASEPGVLTSRVSTMWAVSPGGRAPAV